MGPWGRARPGKAGAQGRGRSRRTERFAVRSAHVIFAVLTFLWDIFARKQTKPTLCSKCSHGHWGTADYPGFSRSAQQYQGERLRAEAGSPGPGGGAAVREGWGWPRLSLTPPSPLPLPPHHAALLFPEAWRLFLSGPVATKLCSALPASTALPTAAWVTTVTPSCPAALPHQAIPVPPSWTAQWPSGWRGP